MKSTDKYSHFFGPSGCVTESALFKYLNHELNTSEMHAIESHVSECLFCSEAIEGYEKQADQSKTQYDFLAIKKEFLTHQSQKLGFKEKDNKRYLTLTVSIAAIFTIIISGYYLFQIFPTNSKKMELAIQSPVQQKDIPDIQNQKGPKSENVQEEKSMNDKAESKTEIQSKCIQKSEQKTKLDEDYTAYDNREGWMESDGVVNTTKATGKSAEYKTAIIGQTDQSKEHTGGNTVVVTEDAEYSGKINDVILAKDKNGDLKQEANPVESIAILDEVESVKKISAEEKVVLGKKDKGKDVSRNQKESVAVTGGVMRSTENPTLNGAIGDYNSGYFDLALPQFEYLSEREKNNHAAVYYLAMCLYNKGEKDSALVQFEKLITKNNNPFYELALWQKARIVEESKDTKQAIELYREIIKNNGSMKTKAIKKVDELDK